MLTHRFLKWSITIMLVGVYCEAIAISIKWMSGRVIDEKKEAVFGAIASLELNNVVISVDTADVDGIFMLYYGSNIDKNTLLKVSYPSYRTLSIPMKQLRQSYLYTFQMELAPGCSMPEIIPVVFRVPLLNFYEPTKRTFLSDEIEKMAR